MRNNQLVVEQDQAAPHLRHRTAAVLAQPAQAQVIVIHQVIDAEIGLVVVRGQEMIVETEIGHGLVPPLAIAEEVLHQDPMDVKDENTLEDVETAIHH